MSVLVCKTKSHKKCAIRAPNNCKWSTLASVGKHVIENADGTLGKVLWNRFCDYISLQRISLSTLRFLQVFASRLICSVQSSCAVVLCSRLVQSSCAVVMYSRLVQSFCAVVLCSRLVQSSCAVVFRRRFVQSSYTVAMCNCFSQSSCDTLTSCFL